jgi:hypothetical protein
MISTLLLQGFAGALLAALVMASIHRESPKLPTLAPWLAVVVYTGIVFCNIAISIVKP